MIIVLQVDSFAAIFSEVTTPSPTGNALCDGSFFTTPLLESPSTVNDSPMIKATNDTRSFQFKVSEVEEPFKIIIIMFADAVGQYPNR